MKRIITFLALALVTEIPFFSAVGAALERTIYVTSDDGPLAGSENVMEIMIQNKVPVTMFMVGLHYDSSSDTIKQLVNKSRNSGFVEIANHSYSHANNHYRHFYHDLSYVIQDLEKNKSTLSLAHTAVTRLPGRDVFRLPKFKKDDPYISKSEDKIESVDDDAIYKHGFYLYGWDLEWAHDKHGKPIQSVQKLVEQIEHKFHIQDTVLPNKLILLMHDEMFQDQFDGKTNLALLIETLKKKNYKFDFIRNYNA